MLRRILGGSSGRVRISQALGAFARPEEGGISPLYVFFEVANAGDEAVEITRLAIFPKGSSRPVQEGPFGDGKLPVALEPGQPVRFQVRAKALARALEAAGHGGRPRVCFVVEDARGEIGRKTFRFRVDEYLRLEDE